MTLSDYFYAVVGAVSFVLMVLTLQSKMSNESVVLVMLALGVAMFASLDKLSRKL